MSLLYNVSSDFKPPYMQYVHGYSTIGSTIVSHQLRCALRSHTTQDRIKKNLQFHAAACFISR